MKYFILFISLLLASFAAAQEPKPCNTQPKRHSVTEPVVTSNVDNPCPKATAAFPAITAIEGPCLQIVGRLCYNAYQHMGKSWFGYRDLDKKYNITLTEKFDCAKPNRVMTTGADTFPVYQSKKVKGLYKSCYGADLKKPNKKLRIAHP